MEGDSGIHQNNRERNTKCIGISTRSNCSYDVNCKDYSTVTITIKKATDYLNEFLFLNESKIKK